MTALLTQVGVCLNSQPLVAMNTPDDNSVEALSPGHFLIGQPLFSLDLLTRGQLSRDQLPRDQLLRDQLSPDQLYEINSYRINSNQLNFYITKINCETT